MQALEESYNNADKAKENAQEAQERYADQASKVSDAQNSRATFNPFLSSKDAESIRKEANEAKSEANNLHNEAQNLRTRIKSTEARFGALEELADKDDDLTENAKAKVGQAKTDSESVEKLTDDALKNIKEIIKELSNMKDISMRELDELGEYW